MKRYRKLKLMHGCWCAALSRWGPEWDGLPFPSRPVLPGSWLLARLHGEAPSVSEMSANESQ